MCQNWTPHIYLVILTVFKSCSIRCFKFWTTRNFSGPYRELRGHVIYSQLCFSILHMTVPWDWHWVFAKTKQWHPGKLFSCISASFLTGFPRGQAWWLKVSWRRVLAVLFLPAAPEQLSAVDAQHLQRSSIWQHSGILGSPTGFFHLQMTFVFAECYPDMEENFFASLVSSVYG